MPSMFEPATYQEFTSRIDRLSPESKRQWGRMSVQQMICHLSDALKGTLGEIPSTFKPNFLASRLGHFIILNAPIPKGKASTVPEFQQTQPGDWTRDVATLKGYLERVVARARTADAVWGIHPRFGKLTREEWGKLLARHLDHHLRQFGV